MFTLEEKVGQLMMVGFDGTTLPTHIKKWLATGRIGGVYLFARNIESPKQVKKLVNDCHASAKYPILVGIDQEGGIVARLREGFTESPGAMALAASGDTELAENVAYMMGRELLAMGINWNFAPVADITHNIDNASVGTRSVGTNKEQVSAFVQAQIRGFQHAGVAATVKHFPGLGKTSIDTHDALARISGSIDYLYEQDLIPFRGAIEGGVACVMTTHVMFEELDNNHPATLSPLVINKILRNDLEYNGAVCTDCMEMNAITDQYGAEESAVLTILAGVDMVMFSHTKSRQEKAYQAVLEAVQSKRISEERLDQSVNRIQHMKQQHAYHNPPSLDIVASTDHQELAQQAANAGTVLVKSGEGFPLTADSKNITCIEFSTRVVSDAVSASSPTAFTEYIHGHNSLVDCQIIDPFSITTKIIKDVMTLVEQSDIVILATRNAHMHSSQAKLAQAIIMTGKTVVLACLRNPYDADILGEAQTIICTNGDSTPSLKSAADAIFGVFTPTGELTVTLG